MKSKFSGVNCIGITLSFLLSLLFALIFLGISFGIGGLNKSVIFRCLQESSYYERTYEAFMERTESIANTYEVPKDIILDKLSYKSFYMKSNSFLKNNSIEFTRETIREEMLQVRETLMEKLKETNGILTELEQLRIDACVEEIEGIYMASIEFPLFENINTYRMELMDAIQMEFTIILISIVLLIGALFSSNKYKHKALRYVGYSIIGASITTIILGFYFITKVKQLYQGEYSNYQKFLELYYRSSIIPVFLIAGTGIVIGVIIFFLVTQMKSGKLRNYRLKG